MPTAPRPVHKIYSGFLVGDRDIIQRDTDQCDDKSGPGEAGFINNKQHAERNTHDNIHRRKYGITKGFMGRGISGLFYPEDKDADNGEHIKITTTKEIISSRSPYFPLRQSMEATTNCDHKAQPGTAFLLSVPAF